MMTQYGTVSRENSLRGVQAWRLGKKPYEVRYLMKLGALSHAEATALIARHAGDTFEINAELFARRRAAQ